MWARGIHKSVGGGARARRAGGGDAACVACVACGVGRSWGSLAAVVGSARPPASSTACKMAPKAAEQPRRKSGKPGRYKPGARKGKPDGRLTAKQALALKKELASAYEMVKACERQIENLERQLREETNRRLEAEAEDDRRPHIRRAMADIARR